MAEIKSFRISDETKERLEALSLEIGGNKDRVFNALMDSYALEKEKGILKDQYADQGKNVETFEQYANTLVRLYLEALKAISSSDERIRTEFHNQLEENARMSYELRTGRDNAQKELDAYKELADRKQLEWDAEREKLAAQIDSLNKSLAAANEQIAARQSLSEALAAQVKATEQAKTDYGKATERCKEMQKLIDAHKEAAVHAVDELRVQKENALNELRTQKENELDKLRAKNAEDMAALRTQKNKELDELQKRLTLMQEQLNEAQKKAVTVRLELSERYRRELNDAIEKKDARISEKDKAITQKDEKIEALQAELIRLYRQPTA